ncbi:hypothetical protein JYU34_001812 [Plutella xylostella]|uniref:Uncharacterized protein n=2 Tax=Plutella xylostella TaxID=51655 RepID=A0ABQ7R4T9_PLUXY|nr:hypothetical protein JYU34_001812 [Plutella xylostella]CAG9111428.1 unnamed protein product [Plutella xylostella]
MRYKAVNCPPVDAAALAGCTIGLLATLFFIYIFSPLLSVAFHMPRSYKVAAPVEDIVAATRPDHYHQQCTKQPPPTWMERQKVSTGIRQRINTRSLI